MSDKKMRSKIEVLVDSVIYLSMGALVMIMTIVVINIIGRVAKFPVFGSAEIIGQLSVISISLCLCYTAYCQANVAVDFLVSRLSRKMQGACKIVACLLSLGTCMIMVWAGSVHAWKMVVQRESSFVLRLPLGCFRWMIAVGFLLLWVVLAAELYSTLGRAQRKDR